MSSLVDPTDDLAETIGGGGGGGGEVPSAPDAVGQAIGAVGQVTSLEIGDHIEVEDKERGSQKRPADASPASHSHRTSA